MRELLVGVDLTLQQDVRNVLGISARDGADSTRFWSQMFSPLGNRGVQGLLIACRGRLKSPANVVATTLEHTIVQRPAMCLSLNWFCDAGTQQGDGSLGAQRPVFAAQSEATVENLPAVFAAEAGGHDQAASWLCENAWTEFIPYPEYDIGIGPAKCTTDAIEALNARYWRAVREPVQLRDEQVALDRLDLVARSRDRTGQGRARHVMR